MRALVAITVVLCACSGCNRHASQISVGSPESDIRAWILEQTPLGSTPLQVGLFIKKMQWFKNNEWSGAPGSCSIYPHDRGAHIISAHVGNYQGVPWTRVVFARWSFDEQDKLIDVTVEKGNDAI
jgi:hypothetical protein